MNNKENIGNIIDLFPIDISYAQHRDISIYICDFKIYCFVCNNLMNMRQCYKSFRRTPHLSYDIVYGCNKCINDEKIKNQSVYFSVDWHDYIDLTYLRINTNGVGLATRPDKNGKFNKLFLFKSITSIYECEFDYDFAKITKEEIYKFLLFI